MTIAVKEGQKKKNMKKIVYMYTIIEDNEFNKILKKNTF